MAFEERIAALQRRRVAAGILNARQRIDYPTGPDSFNEWGLLEVSERAEDHHHTPGDGVAGGHARIDDRLVVLQSTNIAQVAEASETAGQAANDVLEASSDPAKKSAELQGYLDEFMKNMGAIAIADNPRRNGNASRGVLAFF